MSEASTSAEQALRNRASISITIRDTYTQAERNLRAKVASGTGVTLRAAGGVLAIEQALVLTRNLRMSAQQIEYAGPGILEDAGGQYVVQVKEGFFFDDYYKTYTTGPKAGTTTEIGFFEAIREGSKLREKYGYVDWKGDLVRGQVPPIRKGWEPPGGPEPFL
jgi:hypothetical protein